MWYFIKRTLQNEFVNHLENLLFSDLMDFNYKLLDWLLWDNTQRPYTTAVRSCAAILAQPLGLPHLHATVLGLPR
jgi:hypothetical protein